MVPLRGGISQFDIKYHEVLDGYFDFLMEYDLMFEVSTQDVDNFPYLSTEWDSPSLITNCIIEVGNGDYENITGITKEITKFGCKHLELRSYKHLPLISIKKLMSSIHIGKLRSIILYIKWSNDLRNNLDFKIDYPIIGEIFIHSVPSPILNSLEKNGRHNIFYLEDELSSSLHCGCVNKMHFLTNVK